MYKPPMNLLDLYQGMLLDIVCCLAEDPSPRNVLWVSNLAKSCKIFYELTKCSKVWLLLSKSWFQPEHYQNNRIAFMAEIFNYNYPNGSEEYNFTDVDCEQYTKCDKSCNANNCIKFGIPINTEDKSLYHENEKKLTHAMLICMRRLYKGKKGISHDKEGNWLFDSYYEKLAKKISSPNEFMIYELQKYSNNIIENYNDFNKKMKELIEICNSSHMSMHCIGKRIIDIVPVEHFTYDMHYGIEKYGHLTMPYLYVQDFARTESRLYALQATITKVLSNVNVGILNYITGKSIVFLINSYLFAKSCFKYIVKGFTWVKSFIY